MKFIVHASVWDTIVSLGACAFVIFYLIVWGLAALKNRKKDQK